MRNVRLHHLPVRLLTGAFILNTGLSKWRTSAETAEGLHGFAKGTEPFLKRIPPKRFTKILAGGEIALGDRAPPSNRALGCWPAPGWRVSPVGCSGCT
jgi:hypothetical protein